MLVADTCVERVIHDMTLLVTGFKLENTGGSAVHETGGKREYRTHLAGSIQGRWVLVRIGIVKRITEGHSE